MKNINRIYILFLVMMVSSMSCERQSGRRNGNNNNIEDIRNSNKSSGKTIIKMDKKNGVYQIPVEINGVEMYFIFDTGAGLISISATEASFLYKQGKLNDEDIIGTANFVDANGDISEGTIIMLESVKIGDRTIYEVKASVVDNNIAPLLFGQSALERFGKISIDYENAELVFED
jgi:aspartyl protease family protein